MDNGPWTGLGTFGWFLAVWVVMMAAMMFPSVAPTVALYSRMTQAAIAAVAAAVHRRLPRHLGRRRACSRSRSAWRSTRCRRTSLAWDRAGRWVAGATLILAAVYQLTPLKDVCLGKCRSPLGSLLGSWREGSVGRAPDGRQERRLVRRLLLGAHGVAVRVGRHERHWMAVVAGLIAVEKTFPGAASPPMGPQRVLLGLGMLVLIAPHSMPGLTTPTSGSMNETPMMGT